MFGLFLIPTYCSSIIKKTLKLCLNDGLQLFTMTNKTSSDIMTSSPPTSTLMAQRPMALTALRTKSTSTSVAYSFSSARTYTQTSSGVTQIISSSIKITVLQVFQHLMCYCSRCVHLGDVGLRRQANHDVQLLQFDIDWVIVLDKEDLHLVFQDLWAIKKDICCHLWRLT